MPFPLRSLYARFRPVVRPTSRFNRPLRVDPLESRLAPAAQLAVTPLTWNAIGLDSNNVNAGPDQFLVGARVTNTGDAAATNVATDFFWDSPNSFINLVDSNQLNVPSLTAGASQDFYFNVKVTRNSSAYDTTRRFHVTAQA